MTIRRKTRTRTWLLALPLVLSLGAAACGSDDDDGSEESVSSTEGSSQTSAGGQATTTAGSQTSTTEAGLPDDGDPDGVLRYGMSLISGIGVHFDPIQLSTEPPNISWAELVYGTLLRQAEDGTLQPWMAEEVEVVDPQSVRIKVRSGITFTDGAPYDAVALQTSMMRQRFQIATPAILGRLEPGVKALLSVDIEDPLTVLVHLDKPVASLYLDALASFGGIINSPKQIAENPASIDLSPIGAGPYTFVEFQVDQKMVLKKNPDFWDADRWRIAQVEFIHTPAGNTQANALLSDAIDVNRQVPIESLQALEGDGDLETEVFPVRYNTLLMCGGKPPLDNEKVRQAIQIGLDREQFNEVIFGGLGEPAYGYYREDNPSFDPEAKKLLAYDPDRAKQLLTEAGVGEVSLDLITITTHNWERNAEVIQSQLGKIGIKVNIVKMDDVYTNWIQPQAPGALLSPIPGVRTGGYSTYLNQLSKGGAQAYCGIEDPIAIDHATKAVALSPDDPKAIDEYRQANLQFLKTAHHIPLVFEPNAVTWNTDRIGGTPSFITFLSDPRPRLESIYIKK